MTTRRLHTSVTTTTMESSTSDIAWFAEQFRVLKGALERVVLGKSRGIDLALTALLTGGHLMLEDVPGTGKTALARALAAAMHGVHRRIQFTPDLLPSDITGVHVFDNARQRFDFHPGPIFANVVVADEINRASPKTQAALLEVMEEATVTVDGVTRPVSSPFFVVATANPIDHAGTHELPEAQRDRFLIRTALGYPDHAATIRILRGEGSSPEKCHAMVAASDIMRMREIASSVYADAAILDYVARIAQATRDAPEVLLGASVRAAIALLGAARTYAASRRRTFVTPDDVKVLVEPVLTHRIVVEPDAQFEGMTASRLIQSIVADISPPTGRSVRSANA